MLKTYEGNKRRQDAAVRGGFTILELLAVTAIIAMLVALILPAVQQARAAARRLQCQNNLRNVSLAILQNMESQQRFPATANFGRDPVTGNTTNQFSWVVDVLPFLEQNNIAEKWDRDKRMEDPVNQPLTEIHIPVLTCPDDISVVGKGDLSYVVNGGMGFTVRYTNGERDCPVDRTWRPLDLNRNGSACQPGPTSDSPSPTDRDLFLRFGVFFLETWKWDVSKRHHRPGSVMDGMSQTFLASENVRAGYDPADPGNGHWATTNPYRNAFYIGNPCANHDCSTGSIDYSRSNAGDDAINSGRTKPEGSSPVPNSFHPGGVHMSYCDGRVQFLSESIDGGVYAALASPQGMLLSETAFAQTVAIGQE